MTDTVRRDVAVVLFDGFELLDVFGPLEVFGIARDHFSITLVGPDGNAVRSAQGPAVEVDAAYADPPGPDIVLVPGGMGTRTLVEDDAFLSWLRAWAAPARLVTSVCTGAGLLARAGLLDGYRATGNKRSFAWVTAQGPEVTWVPEARWVHDRDRWTSSGVAAGIDMALALVGDLGGDALATAIADGIEHEWHRDASWDPFAAKNGLTG